MRKFGIELEMVAPQAAARAQGPQRAAEVVLAAANITCRTSSYSGRAYDVWQCKSDSSIQPYERGVEVVSRILPATELSYEEVRRACDALTANGYGVNRSCGFHVHISVADLPAHVRQLIVLRYNAMQADISAMLPPSRRANHFAPVLPANERQQLASNIRNGLDAYTGSRYAVVNCSFARMSNGSDARLEFRQAGATTSAAKVIGWVRFLQEMIDEVARRAVGVNFRSGNAPASSYVAPRPIAPVRLGVTIPRMRIGSEAHRAFEMLRTTGTITAAWAQANNIRDNVLRRIIVGFRRHGAEIRTIRTGNGATYVLAGSHTLPTTAQAIFAGTAPAAPAPVAPQPVAAPAAPAATDPLAFVGFDFFAGLSAETTAWVRERRDTFNADADASAAA